MGEGGKATYPSQLGITQTANKTEKRAKYIDKHSENLDKELYNTH